MIPHTYISQLYTYLAHKHIQANWSLFNQPKYSEQKQYLTEYILQEGLKEKIQVRKIGNALDYRLQVSCVK